MDAQTDSTVQEYVRVWHFVSTSMSHNKHLWLYLHLCIGPYSSYYDVNPTWTYLTDSDVTLVGMME